MTDTDNTNTLHTASVIGGIGWLAAIVLAAIGGWIADGPALAWTCTWTVAFFVTAPFAPVLALLGRIGGSVANARGWVIVLALPRLAIVVAILGFGYWGVYEGYQWIDANGGLAALETVAKHFNLL